MKNDIKLATALFCIVVMASFLSCDNKSQKEAEIKTEKTAEQEKLEAEQQSKEEAKEKIDPYLEKGWNFLLGKLLSPSTATFVDFLPPTHEALKGLATELNMEGLEIAIISLDAENSFGAMLRYRFYIFYKNGTPKVVMDADSFESTIVRIDGLNLIRGGLYFDGY